MIRDDLPAIDKNRLSIILLLRLFSKKRILCVIKNLYLKVSPFLIFVLESVVSLIFGTHVILEWGPLLRTL